MSVIRQCVFGDHALHGSPPTRIGARRTVNLRQTGILAVPSATCEIHRLPVGCQTAGSLIIRRIDSPLHKFRAFPFTFFVFLRSEDVAAFHTRHAVSLISGSLLTGGGKENLVFRQHRAVIIVARIEKAVFTYGIVRAFLPYLRSSRTGLQAQQGSGVGRMRLQKQLVTLRRTLVISGNPFKLSYIKIGKSVRVFIARGIPVGGEGFRRVVQPTVALRHLIGAQTALFLFLRRCLGVSFCIFQGSFIIFPDGPELIAFLQVLVGTAGT